MPRGYRTAIFHTRLGWAGVALYVSGVGAVVLPRQRREDAVHDLQHLAEKIGSAERDPMPSLHAQLRAVRLLKRFFAGEGRAVEIPVDLRGHTRFRRTVWKAAQAIPYGETRSYGWIAKRIGKPKAARAVGQAMGANPVPILVP